MKYDLLDCLTRKIEKFDLPKIDNPDRELYYQDNGCNVLGVAHLDYVKYSEPRKFGKYVICPQLDDRLGAWILLHLLPKMGINLDILLTDNEESANSTAQYFHPNKKYNWVIEFDRAGSDIVFYQYDGFSKYWPITEGIGSFTDISDLEHLGVMCANIGIGYYCQHTDNCYAHIPTTIKQVKKFAKFYHKNKDTRFEYSAPEYDYNSLGECDSYYSGQEFARNETTGKWERVQAKWDNDYWNKEDYLSEDYMDYYERENQECENLYWKNRR